MSSSDFKLVRPMTVLDANLLSSNVADPNYTAWSSATGYGTAGGTYVSYTSTNVHQVYVSLANATANTNMSPPASPLFWALVGATNRWAMFDGSVSSQTTNADNITIQIRATGRIDTIAFLNMSAQSVTVKITDASDGVVYNSTASLVSTGGITDWYGYFFEPIVLTQDYVFTDIPPYFNALIDITISYTGSAAKCGACVFGLSKILGLTEANAKVGIVDYSVKSQDAYGNYSITQRAFSKRGTYTVWIEAALVDQAQNLFQSYRAVPILYLACSDYGATILYGFFKDFEIDIAYPTVSICTIQLEGLT